MIARCLTPDNAKMLPHLATCNCPPGQCLRKDELVNLLLYIWERGGIDRAAVAAVAARHLLKDFDRL